MGLNKTEEGYINFSYFFMIFNCGYWKVLNHKYSLRSVLRGRHCARWCLSRKRVCPRSSGFARCYEFNATLSPHTCRALGRELWRKEGRAGGF